MASDRSRVRSYYDNVYHKGARFSSGAVSSYYRPLLASLHARTGARFLDVSCGTGELLRCAEDSGLWSIGLDLSCVALRVAQGALEDPKLVCAEAERLPYRDGTFRYLACLGSLEHYANPRQVLREMMRVSQPKATWVILVPNSRFQRIHSGFWQLTRLMAGREARPLCQVISHAKTPAGWRDLLEEMGLHVGETVKDNSCFFRPASGWLGELLKAACRPFVRLLPLGLSYQVAFVVTTV